jgi:hypothetical protein
MLLLFEVTTFFLKRTKNEMHQTMKKIHRLTKVNNAQFGHDQTVGNWRRGSVDFASASGLEGPGSNQGIGVF